MVRLTLDLIARGTSGYTVRKRDENVEVYVKRLTHLYLENKNIDDIGDDLTVCRNLSVLYLYDNALTRIPNLLQNANLTHLYLQNNRISKVENLAGLHKLTKLYLGGNTISVLEGFEQVENLQELHVENQKLASGEKLLFDPRSLSTLSRSLQVLNVSGNHLDSIEELRVLCNLRHFSGADNQLSDMQEMVHCLTAWPQLYKLELQGNPLCSQPKYRDRLIVTTPRLEHLDGKEVTETSRQFLKNWQANKDAKKKKRQNVLITEGHAEGDMAPVRPQHAHAPGFIMPALQKKEFQNLLDRKYSTPSQTPAGPEVAGFGPGRTHSEVSPSKFVHRIPSAPSIPSRGSLPFVCQETLRQEQESSRYLNTYGTTYHGAEERDGSAQGSASSGQLNQAQFPTGSALP